MAAKYLLLATALMAISPAMAQQPPAGAAGSMPGMAMSTGDTSPSSQAFKAADDKMMTGMGGKLTGNTDQDFVSGMLPHHQGAVEMAQVELKYGKDAKMKQLARAIIKAQDREIALMQAWQKAHPAP